jgi:hypothetical protein
MYLPFKYKHFHEDSSTFLGALAKSRKATVNFVVSVRMEQLGSH